MDSLTADEPRTLAALCDQIIPADDFPSASKGGVVTYIDIQLTRAYRPYQRAFRTGMAQAQSYSLQAFGVEVAASSAEQQLATVRMLEQQNGRFFELLRKTTMEGYYGSRGSVADGRSRRPQLFRLPQRSQRKRAHRVQMLSPEDVGVRAGCGDDGYDLRERVQPAQHSLGAHSERLWAQPRGSAQEATNRQRELSGN